MAFFCLSRAKFLKLSNQRTSFLSNLEMSVLDWELLVICIIRWVILFLLRLVFFLACPLVQDEIVLMFNIRVRHLTEHSGEVVKSQGRSPSNVHTVSGTMGLVFSMFP
jgi:hypothetical protein